MKKSKMLKYQRAVGISIVDGHQFPGTRKKVAILKARPRESRQKEEGKE